MTSPTVEIKRIDGERPHLPSLSLPTSRGAEGSSTRCRFSKQALHERGR